ncbi:MAG: sugar transporter substrate-binding protein [Mycobacterium sp.]|nr:sugar transporter substrate-binding protein [Mycobacterium sp.]MDQ1682489.1 ribose transport system substrate-binding protein [Frankiaceae bacterium]MDQ1723065.1 ribose transport system substrate-binding protein [Frankiaceae bacterium]
MTERTHLTVGGRRRAIIVGAVTAGVLLAGCTSNATTTTPTTAAAGASSSATGSATTGGTDGNAVPGKKVTIVFSGPVADHGFLAAINSFAKKQAALYTDVDFKVLEAAADAPSQIAAVQTAIAGKPDALIIFPQDGDQLTGVGKAAMAAGIPVINLDRKFNDASAYRLFLAGDNYKVGYNAGTYIGQKLKGKSNAVIGEITGIPTLALTKERSQGFKDALAIYGLKVTNQVNASFTVQSGQQAMANLLAAAPKIDAVFNHDDDQNIGSEAAAKQANRTEFFIVGNACSNIMLKHIKDGDARIEADVTFTPAISATAVSLARLIAQGRLIPDLAGLPLPSNLLIDSELVTKANVDQFTKFGWD